MFRTAVSHQLLPIAQLECQIVTDLIWVRFSGQMSKVVVVILARVTLCKRT